MLNWLFKNRSKEREGGVRSALWDAAGGGARLSNWTPASTLEIELLAGRGATAGPRF